MKMFLAACQNITPKTDPSFCLQHLLFLMETVGALPCNVTAGMRDVSAMNYVQTERVYRSSEEGISPVEPG